MPSTLPSTVPSCFEGKGGARLKGGKAGKGKAGSKMGKLGNGSEKSSKKSKKTGSGKGHTCVDGDVVDQVDDLAVVSEQLRSMPSGANIAKPQSASSFLILTAVGSIVFMFIDSYNHL
jgi:hypothetical protein